MENPNTRPYTVEELEELLKEEALNSDISKNNKGSKANLNPVILQDNNLKVKGIVPPEILSLDAEVSTEKPQAKSKLQLYVPFIY